MKVLKLGQDSRDAVKRGIDTVALYTNPTLGPGGKGHMIGRTDLPPRIVDDAISIVMNLEVEDETEQAAIMLMRQALAIQSKNIKDTTATTMNLCQSICSAVFERLKEKDLTSKKVNTIALNKELVNCKESIINKILERSKVLNKEDIYNVALSAGSYEWIARLVTDIFDKIGKDGHVEIEEGKDTSYEILNGMDIKAGYHSDYYINNENRECILKNPYILVTNQRLDSEAIKRVIGFLIPNDCKQAIFIAPDFTPGIMAESIKTHQNGNFSAVLLKLPTFDKDDILIDIATLVKAKFIDRKIHTNYDSFLNEITLENLGKVESAIIGEGKSKLIGGQGDVIGRIKEIKSLFDKSDSAFDKEIYAKRIAALAGAVAFIKVGGVSEFDKLYYKLKVENAVGSVQNALQSGIVKGGGLCLKEISDELEDNNILKKAIRSPYDTIQGNNGESFDILDSVIDATMNIVSALNTACSITGSLLLLEGSSVPKNKKENGHNQD